MPLLYIRNWIFNFYDKEKGPLKSVDEVNTLYQYQGTVGTIVAFVMILFMAKFIDRLSPRVMITFGFFQRALLNASYYFMKSPKSTVFLIVSPLYSYGIFLLAV